MTRTAKALRWAGATLVVLAALLGAAVLAVWLLLDRFDLGPLAAGRLAASLQRPVAIGALHVTPGRWLAVDLRDASLGNLSGGTQPQMATIAHATAEIEALSLLRGPLVIRRFAAEGVSLLLERASDGAANWKFGGRQKGSNLAPDTHQSSRDRFPLLMDATLAGEIRVRTTSSELRIDLAPFHLAAPAPDANATLSAEGAYQGAPVRLDADLGSTAQFRDSTQPFPTDIRLVSGDTSLRFEGTMMDPLGVDGAHGTLTLTAPTLAALDRMAGIAPGVSASLRLSGAFEHIGPLWRLTSGTGALDDSTVTSAMLRLDEAPHGEPDKVALDIAFDGLALDKLLAGSAGGGSPKLAPDAAPGTLVEASLAARTLSYAGLRGADAKLRFSVGPGKIAVPELSGTLSGARLTASGEVGLADGQKGRLSATADVSGLDVQLLRRLLGLGTIPVEGPLDGHLGFAGTGATIGQAASAGSGAAVVAMRGGSIARELVQLVSTNPLALLPGGKGMTPIVCLLGVLQVRAGTGTVAPLRIRSQAGTIAGAGSIDLDRRTLDVVVGSEARTTGTLALDVPVRLSGPIASPTIRPAQWSAEGRALLAGADDPARLEPGLQAFARAHACAAGVAAPAPAPSLPTRIERLFKRLR